MARRWVLNAAPLILLAKISRLELLADLAEEIVIPAGVAQEIHAGRPDDVARAWITARGAAYVEPSLPVAPVVAAWDLGLGESEVLSWAYTHPGFEAIVDDRAARNCAATLGLRVRGTLGILILAKQAGHIPQVAPLFEALADAGLRVDPRVLETALNLAGEL